jgi:hypothetical protein
MVLFNKFRVQFASTSVMGVLDIFKPPPANWKSHLQGNDRANAWKYAAGENKGGSAKTAKQHAKARYHIRETDAIRLSGLKPEDARTAEDREILRKPDETCKKNRIANRVRNGVPVDFNGGEPSFQKKLGPAPDNWNVEMDEEARADAWRFCAGLNDNGTAKTGQQHGHARVAVINAETTRLAKLILQKEETDRTDEEKTFAEEYERGRHHKKNTVNAYLQTPEGIEAVKRNSDVQQAKKYTKKAATVDAFRIEAGIKLDLRPLSDQDAFQFVLSLMDDKVSVVGKALFEALDGMTMRTAFWEGKSTSAMYALVSRGAANVGGSDAESIRFLVKNNRNVPVLTHGGGVNFKSTDQEFEDLELVYCPLRVCNTYADVTTVESAFQLLFGFLEIGRHRLWKTSGVGKSKLLLRKCDMKYIEKTNDKNPKFLFGITILRNISVLRSSTDPNGNETAVSILAGNGVSCDVNWPVRFAPIMDESQRVALEAVQAVLPPNFMARGERKRKAEVLNDTEA